MRDIITKQLLAYNQKFTEEEIELGLSLFEQKDFKANEFISEAGKICDYLFIAKQSITRCYYHDHEGSEQTLWMKPEQTFITEYKSFVNREKSRFTLQFYENSSVWLISYQNLRKLYNESQNWALFGIALTEQQHIRLIDVFVNLLANDATSNYQYIQYMFPRFLEVAPLKDIASMLQMSQVSLSRIRAGKQTKK